MSLFLCLLLGCTNPDSSNQNALPEPQTPEPNKEALQEVLDAKNLDKGQKHPPLPADNPIWEWDAKAFVPDHGWFGEHNWAGVRMRVMGHLAMGYRELARSYLENQEWEKGLQEYQNLEKYLQNADFGRAKFAQEIQQTLLKATQRDIALVQALRKKQSALPKTTGFADLRRRYYELARIKRTDNSELLALQKDLEPYLKLREDLDIASFENFTDRHKLRSRLFEAYSDTIDPLANSDLRWGYWRAEEIPRQALAIGLALEELGGENWHGKLNGWVYDPPTFANASPLFYPSLISQNLKDSYSTPKASAAEFGRLPTGDSLIDVGGQPGPFGIGSLMKLDHKDPEHEKWLEKQAALIVFSLPESPEKATKYCQEAMKKLDSYSHGSRFYNVKQMRNACTRQLARTGHFEEAQEIFQTSFPLHHQDWACPNREGLLLTISGRLYLQNDQTEKGRETLKQAIQAGYDFLENVKRAENGELKEPRPPRINITPKGAPPKGTPNKLIPLKPSNKNPHNPPNDGYKRGAEQPSSPPKQK